MALATQKMRYNTCMNILVAGGCGYIGSHAVIELLADGHSVVVVDNLSNSSKESLNRVEKITGQKITFYEADCTDKTALEKIFSENKIDATMHFAGLKAVGESVEMPLAYYRNNLDATLTLCEVMQKHDVKKFIFSSTASVYGTPEELPLKETSQAGVGITNPYGWTKYMVEQILRDLAASDPAWQITILRYFNVVGAHPSGIIGEDPNGLPNNLTPFIAQVAVGKLDKLKVFGDDYDTPDGTGIRDYIHVVDLVKGHVAALNNLHPGAEVYNLGTGTGVSVMEAIKAFEKASGETIAYEVVGRRAGDIARCFANCDKAQEQLHWVAEKTFDDACVDTWRWQSQNPNGYRS